MPEVVEVQIQADGLEKSVSMQNIDDIIFHDKGELIVDSIGREAFYEAVIGSAISEVFRVGKKVVFQIDKQCQSTSYMVSSLRMTGRWLVNVPEDQIGHSRITFKLSGGDILRYSDVRVFGKISLQTTFPNNTGVDVLEADYADLCKAAFENPRAERLTIKQFILDQSIWEGLGNVYANETLWKAGYHPGQRADYVATEWGRLEWLIDNMKSVLYKGQELGGLSLKDWYHVDGSKGHAQEQLNVYQKTHCACGTKIVKDRERDYDARATYYCPKCQRKRIV
jgi:formamidopyrimidine-DNA glycosylase